MLPHDWSMASLLTNGGEIAMNNYLGMDEFTASYLESALWSSTDDDGTPLDDSKYTS